MLDFPKAPRQTDLGFALAPAIRVTPMGEMMAAAAGIAYEQTVLGQAVENSNLPGPPVEDDLLSPIGQRAPEEAPMTQEDYQQSEFFREGVKFDPRMTPSRAEALSEIFDRREYRKALLERAPGGIGSGILKLGAALGATALDPINYVPILGPGVRALATARLGRIAGTASVAGAEASIATAITEPFIAQSLSIKGETLTSSDIAMDIALAFGVGSAFGGAVGAIAKGVSQRQSARLLRRDGAEPVLDALASAAEDIRADNPVDVGPYFSPESRFRQRVLGETSLSNFSEARAQINRLPARELLPTGLIRPVPTPVEVRGLTRPAAPGRLTLLPVLDSEGAPRLFKDRTGADTTKALREVRQREPEAQLQELRPGEFSIVRPSQARLQRNFNGDPVGFRSRVAAQRNIDQAGLRRARPVRLTPVGDKTPRYGILRGGSARDVDAIEAAPVQAQFVETNIRPKNKAEAQQIRAVQSRSIEDQLRDVLGKPKEQRQLNMGIEQPYIKPVSNVQATKAINGRPTSRTRELPPEETLDEFEINEVEQLRQQGALTDADEATIREADDNVAKAENYDAAYQSLATCITRFAA